MCESKCTLFHLITYVYNTWTADFFENILHSSWDPRGKFCDEAKREWHCLTHSYLPLISCFSLDNRSLQFIVVTGPKNEADNLSDNSQIDSNNGELRATTLVVCKNVEAEVFALSTVLNYAYLVELQEASDEVPMEVLTDTLPQWTSGASVESVAAAICGDPCMVSVSGGKADQYTGNCTASADAQQSCSLYDGSIKVVHTPECERDAVRAAVNVALEGSVDTEPFLDSVNNGSLNVKVTDIDLYVKPTTVTKPEPEPEPEVEPVDSAPVASTGAIFSTTGGGLTIGAKIMTAFGTLAMMALLLAFCCIAAAWRRNTERYKQKMEDDERSLRTDWSSPTDDNSFLKPDFYDLALQHSKLDVHKCHSALCTVCNPNLGVVNMVSVARQGDRWNGPILPHVLSSDLAPEAYGVGGDDIDGYGFPVEDESFQQEESMAYTDNDMEHNRSFVSAYTDDDMMHNQSAVSMYTDPDLMHNQSLNRSANSRGSLFHDEDEGFNFVRIANPRQTEEWDNYAANAVTL
jgi:hypothetical protein